MTNETLTTRRPTSVPAIMEGIWEKRIADLGDEIDEMERQDAANEIVFTHKSQVDARRLSWQAKCHELKRVEGLLAASKRS